MREMADALWEGLSAHGYTDNSAQDVHTLVVPLLQSSRICYRSMGSNCLRLGR